MTISIYTIITIYIIIIITIHSHIVIILLSKAIMMSCGLINGIISPRNLCHSCDVTPAYGILANTHTRITIKRPRTHTHMQRQRYVSATDRQALPYIYIPSIYIQRYYKIEGGIISDIYVLIFVGLAFLRSQFAWRLFLLSGHLAFLFIHFTNLSLKLLSC